MKRIVIFTFVIYVIGLSMSAVTTKRAADSLSGISVSVAIGGGDSAVDQIENELAVFNRRFRLLEAWLLPLRTVGMVSQIVPPIDRQRRATDLLIDRAKYDSRAVSESLKLARSTISLQKQVQAGSISLSDAGALGALDMLLAKMNSASGDVIATLDLASTNEEQFNNLNPNAALISLGNRMSAQETRLGRIAHFSLILTEVLKEDLALLKAMDGVIDGLESVSEDTSSMRSVADSLFELEIRTRRLKLRSTEMLDSTPETVNQSEYGDLVRDLATLNIAVNDLVAGLAGVLDIAVSAIEPLISSQGSIVGDGNAMSASLGTLIAREDELRNGVTQITENTAKLIELDEAGLISLGSLGDLLEHRTEPLLELGAVLSSVPFIAADIFGIGGEVTNYLVLGQTSAELRASGGFTSSVWELQFDDGALVSNDYLEITTFENDRSLNLYPPAPSDLQLHMDAGLLYMRDVGWDPHFPNVAKSALDLYRINHVKDVDGVISLTEAAFVDLTSAIGGFETESGRIGSSDLMRLIESETDENGTKVLRSWFEKIMESLSGETIRSNGIDLISTLKELFDSKGVMIYSTDPGVQRIISEAGWGGRLDQSGNDRLMIVDSNVGWNKVDPNIDRSFEYTVDFSDLTRPQAKLILKYQNISRLEDNLCGEQSHVSLTYEEARNQCYWDFLRVYLPLGASLVGGDTLPLVDGAIASQVGGLAAGSHTVRQRHGDNGTYVSGFIAINPQETRDVVFEYSLPSQILNQSGTSFEYRLDLISQAGAQGRSGKFSIVLPDGYELSTSDNVYLESTDGISSLDIELESDVTLRIAFQELPG